MWLRLHFQQTLFCDASTIVTNLIIVFEINIKMILHYTEWNRNAAQHFLLLHMRKSFVY